MSIQELEAARKSMDEARGVLSNSVQGAISAECKRLFARHIGLENIQFAQKASEYTDEGMYPGVFGPVANRAESSDEDAEYYGYLPAWLDDYYGEDKPSSYDESLGELRRILNATGEDVLSEIFGDTARVIITRGEKEGTISVKSHYVGY
jgi:hypothetical protein